jgi:RimJ/RimL family protein N-acetyltransferase
MSAEHWRVTDGVVALRPSTAADAVTLVAGRDAEWRRWLGPGDHEPHPTACVEVGGQVVGWVDHDDESTWLAQGQVNVGYSVFAPWRGRGVCTRALMLLVHRLALDGRVHEVTALIDADNTRSLDVARRARMAERPSPLAGQRYFVRAVPPLEYADGTIVIRPQEVADLDADLGAKDAEQMRWLWRADQRDQWQAMTPRERRSHARRGLEANRRAFGTGPKWTFAVDHGTARAVGYVDADLANPHAPAGEANIAYSVHPAHRSRGVARNAVGCVIEFVRDHTAARRAHIVVDAENEPSLRVARAVGAVEVGSFEDDGRTMIRHVLEL